MSVLFDVRGGPALFWKKYRSCAGNSPSGVGERLFFAPFGLPARRFGVAAVLPSAASFVVPSTVAMTPSLSSIAVSGASPSSSRISSAKRSAPSQISSSSCSNNKRALFFFADRSAFRARFGVEKAVAFVGVEKRAFAFDLCVGVFRPDSLSAAGVGELGFCGVDLIRFEGVMSGDRFASAFSFVELLMTAVVLCLFGAEARRSPSSESGCFRFI